MPSVEGLSGPEDYVPPPKTPQSPYWKIGYEHGVSGIPRLTNTAGMNFEEYTKGYIEGLHEFISKDVISANRVRSLYGLPREKDEVNHPSHYTSGSIEVWNFIVDQDLDYLRGNVIKYVSRAGKKDPEKELQDLEKAQAYLNKAIEVYKEAHSDPLEERSSASS